MVFMTHGKTPVAPGPQSAHGLLDSDAAAGWLGVTPYTLRRWRSEGRGPGWVRVGRLARYRLADLVAYAEANAVKPGGAA